MKLLEKRLINAELATERKQQIQTGIKLAKSVDALREAKGKEEQELEQFRLVTTKKIQIEIDALIRSKESLKSELVDLAQERTRLLQPLDAEWQEVHQKEAELALKEQEIWSKTSQIESKLTELYAKEKQINENKARIEGLKNEANEDRELAGGLLERANGIFEKTTRETNEKFAQANLREGEVAQREVNATMLERRLKTKQSNQQKKDRELEIRELQLKEGWSQLAQTAERIKNNKL